MTNSIEKGVNGITRSYDYVLVAIKHIGFNGIGNNAQVRMP